MHDVAQFVHLGVVAGADCAAVLEVGRRVFFNRAGDQVKDIGKRVDRICQPGEQRRAGRGGLGFDGGQLGAGIAEGLDLTRGGRAIQDTGGQPLNVKHLAKRGLELGAADVRVVERFDRVEPGVDRRRIDKRLLDPAAQHPLAHRGFGLIQHPKQRATLFPPAHRLGQFEVCAGDWRKPHILRLGVVLHGLDPVDAMLLGFAQIVEHRAEGRRRKAVRRKAGSLLPVWAELGQKRGFDLRRLIAGFLPQFKQRAAVVADVVGDFLEVENRRVNQNLTRHKAAELGHNRIADLRAWQLGCVGFAGRDIGKADAGLPARAAAFGDDRAEVVVLILGQHTRFDDGARRDDPDDIPLDDALGERGVFDLLADRNLVALGDEPGCVGFVGVIGHAAHRGALLPAAGFAG